MTAMPSEHIGEAILRPYSEFRPTGFDCKGFDCKGLGCGEQQDWLVAPTSQTRDSGCLDRANFDATVDALEVTAPDDYEVHRFGHWGPGWFEIILVRPGSEAQLVAEEIACALSYYPVVDDERLSRYETSEEIEAWDSYACEDFRLELVGYADEEDETTTE
jgi:hypothetical protein